MYRVLRNTHLSLGVAAFLFLMMYGMSAVQMAHTRWFSMKPTVSETSVTLGQDTSDDPRAIARALRSIGVRGDMGEVTANDAGYKFEVARPGAYYKIEYARATREARVRINTTGFMAVLNRIHHLGGAWHEYAPLNVWGVMIGLVSGGLILLGVSGIYLWFTIHSERAIGIALLAINLGICVTLLVLIRTA
jgi:hypothetical protein